MLLILLVILYLSDFINILYGYCFAAIEGLVLAKQRQVSQIAAQHILSGKGDNELVEHRILDARPEYVVICMNSRSSIVSSNPSILQPFSLFTGLMFCAYAFSWLIFTIFM